MKAYDGERWRQADRLCVRGVRARSDRRPRVSRRVPNRKNPPVIASTFSGIHDFFASGTWHVILNLLLYFLVCRAEVSNEFLVCPVCTTKLKQACANCKAPLEALWQVCPYCETPVEPVAVEFPTFEVRPPRRRRRSEETRRLGGCRAVAHPDQAGCRRAQARRRDPRSHRAPGLSASPREADRHRP